jgi:hypothetical protein
VDPTHDAVQTTKLMKSNDFKDFNRAAERFSKDTKELKQKDYWDQLLDMVNNKGKRKVVIQRKAEYEAI